MHEDAIVLSFWSEDISMRDPVLEFHKLAANDWLYDVLIVTIFTFLHLLHSIFLYFYNFST